MRLLNLSRVLCMALALCGAVACGPVDSSDPDLQALTVEVKNHYAESLFTVLYEYQDAAGVTYSAPIFSQTRIAANRSEIMEKDIPYSVTSVKLTVIATSLGENHPFEPVTIDIGANRWKTYVIGYDYDFATASFQIKHNWSCFTCLTQGDP